MSVAIELYFPHDEIDARNPNFDLAADYLELTAFFFGSVEIIHERSDQCNGNRRR